MSETDDVQDDAEIEHYVLTDAEGEPIDGERYEDDGRALDARVRLMESHPDGDSVTVEVLN